MAKLFYIWLIISLGHLLMGQVPLTTLNFENEFEIERPDKAVERIKIRYLVNNIEGQKHSDFVVNENKYVKIKKLKGRILNLNGKQLKKLKKENIIVTNVYNYSILSPEDKYKIAHLVHGEYPYIVEYEMEKEVYSLFYWDDFIPDRNYAPIKRCTYKLSVPSGFPIEYKRLGNTPEAKKSVNEEQTIYEWELLDLPQLKRLWGAPGEYANSIGVLFKPRRFTFGSYTGNNSTWETFADFYRQLASDRYALSPEIKEKIKNIIGAPSTELETIKKVYKFLQNKTRYQAVYLNIGGFQPHHANDIFNSCYGDCKDLTTLFIAMLRMYDIEVWPALIHTRDSRYQFFRDFPRSQFNHVICAAFVGADTIWLDGTWDYLAAGDIPPSIEGQSALLIKDDSAEVIRIPMSEADENVFKTVMIGHNYADKVNYEVSISLSGNIANNERVKLNQYNDDDKKTWWLNLLSSAVSNLSVRAFNFNNLKENYQSDLTGEAMGVFKGMVKKMGSRLFVDPNIFSKLQGGSVPPSGERKCDYVLGLPYVYIDSVKIQIGNRYKIEALPEKADLITPFSEYHSRYAWDGEWLTYTRILKYTKERIPAEQYQALRKFRKQVVRLDKQKVVMIK